MHVHDEYTKWVRRKIEEYLRQMADEVTIKALAVILKIDITPPGFIHKDE